LSYCPKCGRAVTSDAKFCEYCATPIPVAVSPISQHVSPSPTMPEPTRSEAASVGHYAGLISRKIPLKFLAVAIVMLLIGVGIGYAVAPKSPTTTVERIMTTTVEQQITAFETTTASWQPPAQGEWKTTYTFTGSEAKDTEDFNVPTNYWRVVYTVKAESEQYAAFYLYVYPSGETAGYVAHVALMKSGSDVSYVRAGPGNFYLKVLAANLNSWTIEVQIQQ